MFLELRLVLPIAFSYFRYGTDNIFHGLAFANFIRPEEAQTALSTISRHIMDGQRLRAEYKKKLPPEEEQRHRLA